MERARDEGGSRRSAGSFAAFTGTPRGEDAWNPPPPPTETSVDVRRGPLLPMSRLVRVQDVSDMDVRGEPPVRAAAAARTLLLSSHKPPPNPSSDRRWPPEKEARRDASAGLPFEPHIPKSLSASLMG